MGFGYCSLGDVNDVGRVFKTVYYAPWTLSLFVLHIHRPAN